MYSKKLFLNIFIMFSFSFADECRTLMSEDECNFQSGCEWNYEQNYCNSVDSEESDGIPDCLMDCTDINDIDPDADPYLFCDWIVSNFGPNNFFNECAEDCDEIILTELEEISFICYECLNNDNCDEVLADEEDWEDEEEEDWEDECRYIDNEEECIEMECSWDDEEGCYREWDEEEDWEDEESQINGYVKLESVTVEPGTDFSVNVLLQSDVIVGGFQFTVLDVPNVLDGIEINSQIDCFDANLNDIDGDLIVIMFSLEGCVIESTDEIIVATINYSFNNQNNDIDSINLILTDLIVSDDSGEALNFESINGSVSLGSYLGDVNIDGELNILDIIQTIDFILLFNQPTELQFNYADVNNDGHLDILDVVEMVNMIQNNLRELSSSNLLSEYVVSNNSFELFGNSIGGFQITFKDDINIKNTFLPVGWDLFHNDKTILAYTFNKSSNGQIKIEFYEDIKIQDIIVSDINGMEMVINDLVEPKSFTINESYPNPFNPTTNISFNLYENVNSSIKIYNISGQLVETILDGPLGIGNYSLTWDADNQVSGIYFVAFKFGNSVEKQKLMLIK